MGTITVSVIQSVVGFGVEKLEMRRQIVNTNLEREKSQYNVNCRLLQACAYQLVTIHGSYLL